MRNSLNYRLLQLCIFVLLILSSFFLFNACNKDAELSDQEISSRSDERNGQVEIQESYNAFSLKRQNVQKCDECYTNPLYYDIELESGRIVDYEGNLAVLFKVKDSPFQYTTWERNQILVKKDGEGNYSFSNLIYLADSSFYAQKKYKPLSIIFTGVIIEMNEENVFQNAFLLSQGETLDKIDKSEFERYLASSNNLDLRDYDDINDPDWNWGDGGDGCPDPNKSHFWRDLGRWFYNKFGSKKGNKKGGNYDYSWVGGFRHGYNGGNNFGFGNNADGTGGGSGIGDNNKYLCEDLGGFWAQQKAVTKINFNEALLNITTKLNVGICTESYTNTDYCPKTPYEILCNSIYSGCFEGDMSVEITEEQFEECLTKVLTPFANTNLPPACLKTVESFNNTYGLNVNPFLLNKLMCGFEDLCANQEAFNCAANEALIEYDFGELANLLPQLEITNCNDKINFNLGSTGGVLPDCEGCSVGEKQVVWGDHRRAREMLQCAIDKLENYNGSSPDDVNTALFVNFGMDYSKEWGQLLSFILKYIKFFSVNCDYMAQNNGDGNCGSSTIAWSYPANGITSVRLCRPNYWNENSTDRSSTLIHEWMHLYYIAGDWAYDWQTEKYKNIPDLLAKINADSFSNFVKDLCHE